LSHFVNAQNPDEHYFYKWSDCDDLHNRWLIFGISTENLSFFFDEKLSLLALIQKTNFLFFVDLDTNLNTVNTFVCPTQKIPSDYLPSERSFFKESQYEQYAISLRNDLKQEKKDASEHNFYPILLKEMISIKETQERQNLLLNLIMKNLDKKPHLSD